MMPSNRRVNAFFLVIVLVALLTIYISASARQTRSSDFYTKTQDAIDASRRAKDTKAADAEVATGEDIRIKDRLEAAATAAKAKAEEKAESYHGSEAKQKALKVAESLRDDPPQKNSHSEPSKGAKAAKEPSVKGEKSVAGRIKLKGPKETMPKVSSDVEDVDIEADKEDAEAYREETEDEQKAHAELSEILKRSPIIIFSKTYCPYSKKAKHILLEKYKIQPPPFVVELDIHPLGKQLQAYLGPLTGRKTVPNILIQAKSIGGGDDIARLDETNKLIETVLRMGGKRMSITKVLTEAEKEAQKEELEKKKVASRKKRSFWS